MLNGWTVVSVGLAYVGVLFAVATWGDRLAKKRPPGSARPLIYALSLGIYCTSWTYFGSVGLASKSGFEFAPIYIGPILVFALGWPVIQAIAGIAKRQNITSIADFISARYGKSELLGALVAVIAVIGIIPYISIQLKAVSFALETMIIAPGWPAGAFGPVPAADGLAFMVAAAMAAFAVLFGTRHIDTTEHQNGLMLAIAVESVVKLLAFLAVGVFVVFAMMGGIGPLFEKAAAHPAASQFFSKGLDGGKWLTMTLLAVFAIILLPRQFHVTVVENAHSGDIKRAAWLFPLYLVAINLFVVPVAIAGLMVLEPVHADGDTFVLALPVSAGNIPVALIAFLGGLSAATAMVIVETIALSIMVCNNLVVPILLRRRGRPQDMHQDMGRLLIAIRRWSIAVILILAYAYFRMAGSSAALAQTGLISFAAIAQFAPAFFGGLIWKRATARGALGGTLAGFGIWFYTMLLPSFADAGWIEPGFIEQGPLGLAFLKPRMLFGLGFDPLTHGVLWSLLFNTATYVALSLSRQPTPIERLQANAFVSHDMPAPGGSGFRLWRTAVTFGQVQETVARYLGPERAQHALAEFAEQRGVAAGPEAEADVRTLRFAENLLASAVGTASSRLVMGLLLERHSKHARGAMKLLDDASAAIQYNRDLLQSAIDNVRQGIAVFDKDLTLICWNLQFRELMDLPAEIGRIGAPLGEVLAAILRNTDTPPKAMRKAIEDRIGRIAKTREPFRERLAQGATVIEVSSSAMPDGGTVVTFADITESVAAADELRRANDTLERRVAERTTELTSLNTALERARAEAEAANLGKTRFLAAASHDILQPLNAARLFTSSLVERHASSGDGQLVRNVDASLEAVEEILATLLDISRLDAGALKPELSAFKLGDLLQTLAVEFAPMAQERGLALRVMPCRLAVRSDRKMLRRILQNLISNAIKYTPRGRVLVGCRRRGGALRIEIHDSGPGIPEAKQELVFREFERLGRDGGTEPGLGLGLAIVERMSRMLGASLKLASKPGSGSVFSVSVPITRLAAAPLATLPAAQPATAVSGLRILVIDNEASILKGMETLLEGWGCEATTARSAADAVRAWEAAEPSFDMMLADYHLHRGDGLTVIQSLRKRAGRHVPAILITADRSRKVQEDAAAIAVHYLKKPLKPAALRAAMTHAIARAEAAE